jgi:hypothetical protein
MLSVTNATLPLELCLTVDDVCDAFEQAWMGGARPLIEDRLGGVPEVGRPMLLEELVRIAFNPADKPDQLEQIVPRDEANTPPRRRERLGSTGRLTLNDGEGLQVFAVVASRQELPAYTEWRKQGPPLPWKRIPATVGVVWRADGTEVRSVLDPRFVRAEEKDRVDDRTMIRALAEALKGLPGVEAVSALGFAVDRAD